MKLLKLILLGIAFNLAILGQAQQPANPTQVQVQRSSDNPLYKITVNVVERTTKAINYRHHSGSTKIDFRGTPLLPEARGEAKKQSKQGYIEIEVEFDNLQGATRFGPEYLTYVMWAITPEGRATNLGGFLLSVYCHDTDWARRAETILKNTGADAVSFSGGAATDLAHEVALLRACHSNSADDNRLTRETED